MSGARVLVWCLAAVMALSASTGLAAGTAEAKEAAAATEATQPPVPCAFAAHRGDHRSATENGLNAFRRAIVDGATYLEMDVRATRDGALVLMHDPTVDRTTRGHGAVSRMTWRQVRAGRLDDGEPVPTLGAVLAMAKASPVQAFVEIKSVPDAGFARLMRRVAEFGVDRVVVNSFDPAVLLRFKARYPQVRTARDVGSTVPAEEAVGYGGVMIDYRSISDEWLQEMRDAGVPVYAWTVDLSPSWRTLSGAVDVILTDRPRGYALYRRTHCPTVTAP